MKTEAEIVREERKIAALEKIGDELSELRREVKDGLFNVHNLSDIAWSELQGK